MSERRNPYLFVVGCPRSGTTLLQRMLNAHPDLAVANDTHFITRAVKRLDRSRLVRLDNEIVSLARNYRRFRRLGLSDDAVDAAAAASSDYVSFVSNLYDRLAEREGKQFAGEKTPDYCRSIKFLANLFPWAHFVHIIRDGRDVALSTIDWAKEGKGPSSWPAWSDSPVATCALWWRWQVGFGIRDGRALGGRYTEIIYEHLVDDPERVLLNLSDRVGLPFHTEMLQFAKGKTKKGTGLSAKSAWLPATSGLRDWRTQMRAADVEVFEAVAGDLLERLHYDRQFKKPSTGAVALAADVRRRSREKILYRSSIEKESQRVFIPRSEKTPSDERPLADDSEIIRREADLEGLATIFDGAALRERLASYLHVDVDLIAPVYVRYKPGMNCLVGYEARAGDKTFWLYGKCHGPLERKKAHKALQKRNEFTPLGPSAIVFEDIAVVVRLFPNDAKLPELWRFQDDLDRKLVARMFDDHEPLTGATFEPIRWKPERRLVVRMSVDGRPRAALKFMTPRAFKRIWSFQRHAGLLAPIRTPKVLGSSMRLGAIAYEWLDGNVAAEYLQDSGSDLGPLDALAEALAEVHALMPRHVPTTLPGQFLQHTRASLAALASLAPELAATAKGLLERVADLVGSADNDQLAFIHGDFYAKQVLLQGDGAAAILDFDAAAIGDRHLDLGNFVAHLERDRIRERLSESRVLEIEDRLLEAYRKTGSALDDRKYNAYTAGALLRLLPHPFRFRECHWLDSTNAILESASRYLDRCSETESYPGVARLESVMERALERSVIEASFAGLLNTEATPRPILGDIELVRYKPGRRCLIRYDLTGPNGMSSMQMLGKIRAKGLDSRTFEVTRALYEGDFGPQHGDGIHVPRPVGCVPSLNMWLQEVVEGKPLDEILLTNPDFEWGSLAGRALAKLHRLGTEVDRVHGIDREIEILEARLPEVARRRPDLSERIIRLLQSCRQLAADVSPYRMMPVHRDFHPGQLLFDGPRIYLVDFDLYAMGDPALDIGNFAAHVLEFGLRTMGNPHAMSKELDAFLSSATDADDPTKPRRVQAYTWLSLARHVWISDSRPDRRHVTESILAMCEEAVLRQFEPTMGGFA